MKKILVASHGSLASGVKSVAQILLHDEDTITAVDCYLDDSDPFGAVQEFIDGVGPNDEAVIFSDLLGGSVCNRITQMRPEEHGIIHVTGFNIALVLECLITSEPLTKEFIDATIASGREAMQRVVINDAGSAGVDAEDDDDFFA